MNSQRECWEALLEGRVLINKIDGYEFYFEHDILCVGFSKEKIVPASCSFKNFKEFEVTIIIPQINPNLIDPDFWGVVLSKNGIWYMCEVEPKIENGRWASESDLYVVSNSLQTPFYGVWTESKFTRAQIENAWKGDYNE